MLKQLLTPYTTHKDRYLKAHSIGFLKRLQEINPQDNYCDICSDTESTTNVICTQCKEQHKLCNVCFNNGHVATSVSWTL